MRKISYRGYEFLIDEEFVQWGDIWWGEYEKGNWDPYLFDMMDRFLNKTKVCIDFGAWIGPTVLYAAKLCKQVYALEPDPLAYKQLCATVKLNDIKNIQIFREAILDYDGTANFGNLNMGDSMTRIGLPDNLFEIQCSTLESFIIRNKIEDIGFIKIDVESAEEIIFKTFDFFQKYTPTLYVELHADWFKNKEEGLETIRKVGRLYKHRYDINLRETDMSGDNKGFVFTND